MTDHPLPFAPPMVRALWNGTKLETRRALKSQPPSDAKLVGIYAPGLTAVFNPAGREHHGDPDKDFTVRLPFAPGDRIWVREPWGVGCRPCPYQGWRDGIEYKADAAGLDERDSLPLYDGLEPDDVCLGDFPDGWRSPIHMPRWASRLTLTVGDVWVERVQDITEEGAKAEGVYFCPPTEDDLEWYRGYCEETCGRTRAVDEECECYGPMQGVWRAPGVRHSFPSHDPNPDAAAPTARSAFSLLWDDIHGPGAWERNDWVAVARFSDVRMGNIDR